MKYKIKLSLTVILGFISLILLFVSPFINLYLFSFSLILLIASILTLMNLSTKNYIWTCEKCGESFEINLKENILGINSGVNIKTLYCPNCNDKTICKGARIK